MKLTVYHDGDTRLYIRKNDYYVPLILSQTLGFRDIAPPHMREYTIDAKHIHPTGKSIFVNDDPMVITGYVVEDNKIKYKLNSIFRTDENTTIRDLDDPSLDIKINPTFFNKNNFLFQNEYAADVLNISLQEIIQTRNVNTNDLMIKHYEIRPATMKDVLISALTQIHNDRNAANLKDNMLTYYRKIANKHDVVLKENKNFSYMSHTDATLKLICNSNLEMYDIDDIIETLELI